MQYTPYVNASDESGLRQGRLWKCEEGIDEVDEYESNLIRRICGLLHVSGKESSNAKTCALINLKIYANY